MKQFIGNYGFCVVIRCFVKTVTVIRNPWITMSHVSQGTLSINNLAESHQYRMSLPCIYMYYLIDMTIAYISLGVCMCSLPACSLGLVDPRVVKISVCKACCGHLNLQRVNDGWTMYMKAGHRIIRANHCSLGVPVCF